jgi:hypothetical protein
LQLCRAPFSGSNGQFWLKLPQSGQAALPWSILAWKCSNFDQSNYVDKIDDKIDNDVDKYNYF